MNAAGDLIGIVSRRDLIKVFLRSDEEITAEVGDVLAQILLDEAGQVAVSVLDGVVTLDGALDDEDLIPVAVGLASGVDGVVAVVNRLTKNARARSQGDHQLTAAECQQPPERGHAARTSGREHVGPWPVVTPVT